MSVFCDQNTPDFIQQDCGVERSGIVAVALISTDVGTPSDANLASATYWTTLTGQSPALAHILLKTRGEYARPTVTSEEGFGREAKQNTSADHVVNFEVEGILDNRDFWESANRKKWKFAFVTAGDILHYVDEPTTIDGRINNPKDIKMSAYWQVEAAWTSFDNPRVVDVSAITTFDE
jgi:hypothetical protein